MSPGERRGAILGASGGLVVAGSALFFHPSLPRFEVAKGAVAAILLVAFLFRHALLPALLRGEGIGIPFRAPLLLLLGAFAASLAAAGDRLAALRAILSLGGAALFAGALHTVPGLRAPRAFLAVVVIAGAGVSVYGLLQRCGVESLLVRRFYESVRYPVSTFGNTNAATEFVAPCVAVSLAALSAGGLPRPLAAACLVLGPLYAGTAGTRASAVALAAACAFVLLNRRSRGALLAGLCVAAAWSVGILLPRPSTAAGPGPADLASDPGQLPDSFLVRSRLYGSTLDLLADHPILGVGAGNFAGAFPPYRDAEEAKVSSRDFAQESAVGTAHSDPLQIAAETGLLGALAILWLGARAGRRALRASGFPATLGAAGAVAIAVNSLFRSPLLANPPVLLLFAGLLSLLEPERRPSPPSRAARLAAALSLPALGLAAFQGAREISAEFLLGRYLRSEPPDRASLEAALRRSPGDPYLLAAAGREYLENPPVDLDRASAFLDRALALRPHEPAWVLNRGVAAARAGRLEEAQVRFRRFWNLSPFDPRGPHDLGELHLLQGLDDDAIRAFRDEARLVPGSNPLLAAALHLARKGERRRAERLLEAHLKDYPQDRARVAGDPLLAPLVPR